MLNYFLITVIFRTFSCSVSFVTAFNNTVHFRLESYKFCNYEFTSFILELSNYFLISDVIKFRIFSITTQIKYVFVRPKVFVNVFCFSGIS